MLVVAGRVPEVLGGIRADVARTDVSREAVPREVIREALLDPPMECHVVWVSKRRPVAPSGQIELDHAPLRPS